MSPAGGIWAPIALRVLRQTVTSTSKMLRAKLVAATRPLGTELQPVAIRSSPTGRQPIHPAALLRQQKRSGGKWFSTRTTTASFADAHAAVRRYLSNVAGRPSHGFDRSRLPASNASRTIAQLTRGHAPFASTLRPNLTGGTLPRTAGGYAMPGAGRTGSARYFSHTPAAPAQVVQNVSQAMRAFWTSGQRARFDGVGADGKPRYRAVSAKQEETRIRMSSVPRNQPGAFIDFALSPTLTALSPLAAAFPFVTADAFGGAGCQPENGAATLGAEGFLDSLSVDFDRSLKDLSAIMADLKRLAGLGDLSVVLEKKSVLRVRFPGVDAHTVERLCDEIGLRRGIVGQDEGFDESVGAPMALCFPYAPDNCVGSPFEEKTITSPGGSMRSHGSALSSEEDDMLFDEFDENPWLSSPEPEGYASASPAKSGSEEYEGLEGIYRFLEECDREKRRF